MHKIKKIEIEKQYITDKIVKPDNLYPRKDNLISVVISYYYTDNRKTEISCSMRESVRTEYMIMADGTLKILNAVHIRPMPIALGTVITTNVYELLSLFERLQSSYFHSKSIYCYKSHNSTLIESIVETRAVARGYENTNIMYTYDDDGNLVSKKKMNPNGNPDIIKIKKSKDTIEEIDISNATRTVSTSEYYAPYSNKSILKYKKYNLLVQKKTIDEIFDFNGNIVSTVEITDNYDSINMARILENMNYYEDGKVKSRTTSVYYYDIENDELSILTKAVTNYEYEIIYYDDEETKTTKEEETNEDTIEDRYIKDLLATEIKYKLFNQVKPDSDGKFRISDIHEIINEKLRKYIIYPNDSKDSAEQKMRNELILYKLQFELIEELCNKVNID